MNFSDVLDFIRPDFSNGLQLPFALLLLFMFFGTIISTHFSARDEKWEKKWNNSTPDNKKDDLDIDHGSVTDLWHAVATFPEKLAEVMPGLLLVVGLLGTFLGLGIALNDASNILSQSNALSPGATANSMQEVMKVLQGMGTKFKTSTWGIVLFLLLKVWSSLYAYEEKRLAWVIRKVKSELELRKTEIQTSETAKQQALFTQIHQAAGLIVQEFARQVDQLSKIQSEQHKQSSQIIQKGILLVHNDLAEVNKITQSSSESLKEFMNGTQAIVQKMSDASEKIAQGADRVGHAGSDLVAAIDAFQYQFTEVLNNVRTDLSDAITKMSAQAADTLKQGSEKLGAATLEISKALEGLSKEVTTTMTEVKESIGNSLKIQQEGAVLFRRSSDTLNENVAATTELVNKLGEDIRSGLQAVSDSGRRMVSIGKSLETLVPELSNLSTSMEPLNKIFDHQHALLKEVQSMRAQLQELPAQIQSLFSVSGLDIRSGLQAVSDSNLGISNIGKSLETIVPELSNLPTSLEPLNKLPDHYQAMIKELQNMRVLLQALPVQIQRLISSSAASKDTHKVGDSSHRDDPKS